MSVRSIFVTDPSDPALFGKIDNKYLPSKNTNNLEVLGNLVVDGTSNLVGGVINGLNVAGTNAGNNIHVAGTPESFNIKLIDALATPDYTNVQFVGASQFTTLSNVYNEQSYKAQSVVTGVTQQCYSSIVDLTNHPQSIMQVGGGATNTAQQVYLASHPTNATNSSLLLDAGGVPVTLSSIAPTLSSNLFLDATGVQANLSAVAPSTTANLILNPANGSGNIAVLQATTVAGSAELAIDDASEVHINGTSVNIADINQTPNNVTICQTGGGAGTTNTIIFGPATRNGAVSQLQIATIPEMVLSTAQTGYILYIKPDGFIARGSILRTAEPPLGP